MGLQTTVLQKITESTSAISEKERNFSDALAKFTEPFAHLSNASFIYSSRAGRVVSIIGEPYFGSQTDNSGNGNFGTLKYIRQEVYYNQEYLGRVVLCCAKSSHQAEKTLEKIVDLAKRELSRIEDEKALLAELGASWESLQAVYELNTDFSTFQDSTILLKKITARTAAINSKIQSVLWLENDEWLEPAAAKCSIELAPRNKTHGLIGKTYAGRQSVIYNDVPKADNFGEFEIEFKNARRLAIVPLMTGLAAYGVLAVWFENEDQAFDSQAMRLLDTLALQAAMITENDRLHRKSIENAKLNQEIEIGSKIQKTLLSAAPPYGLKGISIATTSVSSQKIDGDFYDFIEHGEDCFDLLLGDVMGKGIPAALVGAAAKNCFLRTISRLQTGENNLLPPAEKIVTLVNNEITPKLIQFDSFVTACYTRFNLATNKITFVDCGHTKTIHFHLRSRKITLLKGENPPLGFTESEVFKEKNALIEPGDLLFFYSDGVTETKNPEGELFGVHRLRKIIRQNADAEPQQIISKLLEALNKFSFEQKFDDDLTCLAVRFGALPA